MQYYLEHAGTGVAAISGVLAARGKQVDLFGIVVLALVTALGGGTLRDLILNARPVFWVADDRFLITAIVSALATFVLARFLPLSGRWLDIADAGSLALFTVLGLEKSLAFGASPLIAIIMGIVTGTVGGMIRDVLTGEIPLVFRGEIHLYATAALCGAVVFIALRPVLPNDVLRLTAAMTTLLLRLAAIAWRINLPVFQAKDADGTRGNQP